MDHISNETMAEPKAQATNPLCAKKEALIEALQTENEQIMKWRQQKETIEHSISSANDRGQRMIGALSLIEELMQE